MSTKVKRLFAGRTPRRLRNEGVEGEGPGENIRNAMAMVQMVPRYVTDTNAKEFVGWYALERADLTAILNRLKLALHQVETGVVIPGVAGAPVKGYHRKSNPVLAVLGNPRAVGTIKATWAQMEYVRPDDPDGKDIVRVHEFKDGLYMTGLDDGSVHLWRRDGKALFVMQ